MDYSTKRTVHWGKLLTCGLLALLLVFQFCAVNAYAAPVVYKHRTGKEQVRELTAAIDISFASDGYAMCRYSGSADKAIVQVNRFGSKKLYDYHINTDGEFEAIPFSQGDGLYSVRVYAHSGNGVYRLSVSTNVDVKLDNPFLPFLYPSQTVYFDTDSAVVAKGDELAQDANSPLEIVERVYKYLIENIEYDHELAASDRPGYISNADKTLESGMGICLDYAVLMAAMLRTQGIPTRVVCGRMGDDSLHAWISFYTEEAGTINSDIELKGKSWNLLDPTYAAADEGMANAYRIAASISDEYRVMYNF